MLRAQRDILVGEQITVDYGPSYDLDDLSAWAECEDFALLVGQCRWEFGLDVFSVFGEYVWEETSTFYCSSWDEGRASPENLTDIDLTTIVQWKTEGYTQVFLVRAEDRVLGCAVRDLVHRPPPAESKGRVFPMKGVHHVLLLCTDAGD